MKASKIALLGSMVVLIALSIMPVVGAQAAFGNLAAGPGLVVSKAVTPAQQNAALAFWTHEQLAAAKPLDTAVDFGSPKPQVPLFEGLQVLGVAGSNEPGAAAPGAASAAKKAYPADWAASAQTADLSGDEFAGTSQVYSSYTVNSWLAAQKIYPHEWVGRLSFNTGSGTGYCSATAQRGNNFVTAAHCVYDTSANRWYSGWVFTPAYRNGNAPFGSFPATVCTILTAWMNLSGSYNISTWTQYDVAVCTVRTNSAGQTLNNAVGYAGQRWNAPYAVHVHNMGYPFNNFNNTPLPSAGAFLRTCVAETAMYSTNVLREGCNYGPGISGGPWITNYALSAVAGYVDSVNSGLFLGQQNLYGIRFTDTNIRPICSVRGC